MRIPKLHWGRHTITNTSWMDIRHMQTCRINKIHTKRQLLSGTQGRGFRTRFTTRWHQCAGFTLAAEPCEHHQ